MTIKRQWTLATALVCLLVLVAGYLLLVKPQHSKATSVKAQTSAVQGEITQLRAQLATLVEESKSLTGQEATLEAIEQKLPATPQEPDLLTDLDAAASKDGVDLTQLNPGNPAAYTYTPIAAATPSAGATTAPAAAAAVPGLADIPVTMTATGSYFQLENFLDELEGMHRSMLVNSFTLTYAAKAPTAKSTAPVIGAGEISANINAEVFMSTAALGSTSTGAAGSTTATPSASASS